MSLRAFEPLAHHGFALGGHGGYDNVFVSWPGLRLVQGLSKAFSAREPRGEAEGGAGSQPPLWSPAWEPWGSLDILHILGRGRGFLQLIHTQKCWDEMRDQIYFLCRPGGPQHLTPHIGEGWDREGTLRLPHPWGVQPWILPCQLGRLLPFAKAKEPLTPWCCSSPDAEQILSIH